MQDVVYTTMCGVCDTEQQLVVFNEDEPPQYCAMCGEQMEWLDEDGDRLE